MNICLKNVGFWGTILPVNSSIQDFWLEEYNFSQWFSELADLNWHQPPISFQISSFHYILANTIEYWVSANMDAHYNICWIIYSWHRPMMNCQSQPCLTSQGTIWSVNFNASAAWTHSETGVSSLSKHRARYLWLAQMFHHSFPASSHKAVQVIPGTTHPSKVNMRLVWNVAISTQPCVLVFEVHR